MEDNVRRLVESEWEKRLGVSRSELRTSGVQAVTADLGANAAMSFLFGEKCIVVVAPDELAKTATAVAGIGAQDAFTEAFLHQLVGQDAQIDGPSWHSYINERSFNGRADTAVSSVSRTNDEFVEFLNSLDIADVTESGFSQKAGPEDDPDFTMFWSLREHGRIAAVGNMSEWRGLNADVGVLTHPHWRGHGLAGRLVATMVATMLPEAGVIRYRALTSNGASLAVARRLGFEPFGQNYRARRP